MKKISANKILFFAVLMGTVIMATYANSVTMLYGGLELLIAGFCYLFLLLRWRKTDPWLLLFALVLTGFSLVGGLRTGNIKSVILLSISLILPLAVSVLHLDNQENDKTFQWAFLIGFALVFLQKNFQVLGELNSNSIGFWSYMCISVGFVWYACRKKKILPMVLLLIGFMFSRQTESRNVAIVTALATILLLLPKKWYKNKNFFRTIYLLTLVYTIFAAAIMEWGFETPWISDILTDYTEQYSDKTWTMAMRIAFLKEVKIFISNMSIFHKFFGNGVLVGHGHNMFYQSILTYGYLGTALLYAFYIRIFEMARKLIATHEDKIALGCTIALLGCFMLNGADVFLIGIEACTIIPQVLMGIIIFRYRTMMQTQTQLTEGEMTRGPAETNQNLG
ncbi:MAG: hypothetical protein J6K84_05650 [Oscillospiraceae bacterium]|nr:hypothetical protein [Oscillospiraceae bacterium]